MNRREFLADTAGTLSAMLSATYVLEGSAPVKKSHGRSESTPAKGPLRAHSANPRYFTDGSGKAIYLTGSHTWGNFKDYGLTDPPSPFDYAAYLDFLTEHHHNFIRLWSWELPRSHQGQGPDVWYRAPFPWPRTGPGIASDGKPKFDLSRFDPAYFDRLRSRVSTARERGIYVSIMLFDGYGPQLNRMPGDGFPFDGDNNVNGISCGGTESQSLHNPSVTAVQEAYVRRVIDAINDQANVLYEVANEAGSYSTEWQYHIIRLVKEYEAGKPLQHPIGMTFQYEGGTHAALWDSPADWISPSGSGGYGFPSDPPAADGRKMVVNDTDHSAYYPTLQEAGPSGQRAWVWKNFLRGNHVLFMDPYLMPWPGRNVPRGLRPDPSWDPLRQSMGLTRIYSDRVNLAKMEPLNALASTGYCLANPGKEYLVYLPDGGEVHVELTAAAGNLAVEWTHPVDGKITPGEPVPGGDKRTFKSPFEGDSVLYIRKKT